MQKNFKYSNKEEFWNVLTHGAGLVLAILGTVLLIVDASLHKSVWHIVSFSIFGFSMILLYTASTIFHASAESPLKNKLNIFDHASIYVLIAGTYTPFVLVTLRGYWGWSVFGVIWGLAIAGIIFKLFFTGRFRIISTLFYILMGLFILIAIKPLMQNLDSDGFRLLIYGGISYIIGAVLYLIRRIPYNHAIFHIFVLLGTLFHFLAIYYYV
jgi:hemolysin III